MALDHGNATALAHRIFVAAKAGALIPVTSLHTGPEVRLGIAYAPPVLRGRLAGALELGYSQHAATKTGSDPRLATGSTEYTVDLTEQHLSLFLGPQVFLLDPKGRLVPYVAVGAQVRFLKTGVSGESSSASFGQNTETGAELGVAMQAGVGFRLGPGMLLGELGYSLAPVAQEVTGKNLCGGFAVSLGYSLRVELGR